MTLQTERVRTLDQVRAFVEGSEAVDFTGADRGSVYEFVRRALVRLDYGQLGKSDKELVRRFGKDFPGLDRSRAIAFGQNMSPALLKTVRQTPQATFKPARQADFGAPPPEIDPCQRQFGHHNASGIPNAIALGPRRVSRGGSVQGDRCLISGQAACEMAERRIDRCQSRAWAADRPPHGRAGRRRRANDARRRANGTRRCANGTRRCANGTRRCANDARRRTNGADDLRMYPGRFVCERRPRALGDSAARNRGSRRRAGQGPQGRREGGPDDPPMNGGMHPDQARAWLEHAG